MRAAGFEPEDYDADVVEVWSENEESVRFFGLLRTQWRIGMSGATGLDYTAVLAVLRHQRLSRQRAQEVFDDVRVMEFAALEAMRKK